MSAIHCQSTVRSLALVAGVTLLLGCAGAPAGDVTPPVEAPPVTGASHAHVGDFLAHLSPRDRAVTFQRVHRSRGVPGLSPQDLNNITDTVTIDNDGTDGSGSSYTVELVTNSVGDNFTGDVYGTSCPGADQFCANVTLRSFYPRSLSNVFVQATAVNDVGGLAFPGHDAVNSDASELGLDNTHGLWKYTGSGVSAPGVVGQSNPYNAGTVDWSFANPDDADTYIVLSVFAALSYTDYATSGSSASFIDACGLGSSTTSASASQTMPFLFGLWDTASSTVNFNERGMITLGATSGTASGANTCLPDGSAPAPAVYVFWDDLTLGAGGQMCWTSVGSEPNRQFVIEWSGVDFASDDPGSTDVGSSLTFEAILSEGTNAVDLVYDTMSPPGGSSSTRPTGTSATVGTQDSGASVAPGASCNSSGFGSGSAYRLDPSP
jgi:hypothetical protein